MNEYNDKILDSIEDMETNLMECFTCLVCFLCIIEYQPS